VSLGDRRLTAVTPGGGGALQREKLVPSLPTRPSRVPDLLGKAVKTGEYPGRVPRERAMVGGLPSHSSRAPSRACFCQVTKAHEFIVVLVDRLGCRVSSIVSAHRESKCTSRCVGATRGRLSRHPFCKPSG
jgi:hypothetical protein